MNKCIFTGNLTRDPEVKYTPSGKAVCNVGLAMNRKIKDNEQVTFIDLVAWEKTAELMGEYLNKGSRVAVVARCRQETWEDKDTGNNRSKLVFDVEELEFLDKKGDRPDAGGGESSQAATTTTKKSTKKAAPPADDNDDAGDDVPF